jgi:TIR domain
MKILFMGSIPTFQRTETREITDQEQPFARACAQMGYAAAARQHTILISDNHPASADYHVLDGVLKFIGDAPNQKAHVEVNRPEGSELVFDRLPSNVVVSYRFHPDFEHVWHGTLLPNLAAVDASDVMITLGGRLTVRLMGQLAADKERPVLAIPSFGGASTEIYESLKFAYRRLLKDRYHELSLLKSPWRDGFADKVMDLVKILSHNKSVTAPHSYFLSYVWEDSEFADHIEVLLHRFRRAINRDESIFAAGVDLSDVVKSFINESDTFIALYNERFHKSTWCPQELEYARNRQAKGLNPKRVVLLMLDDAEPPIRFSNMLRQAAGDRSERELSIRRLVEEERDADI